MKKKKVLIIQSRITPYRIPIFNCLAEKVDLTVVCDNGEIPENIHFKAEKIAVWESKYFRKIHKVNMLAYVQNYDVVIMMLDPSYLTTHILVGNMCKIPVILWGIGVAAARNMRYDGCQKTAEVLFKLIRKADSALFYSDYPVRKYSVMGLAENKMFVANNTVEVFEGKRQKKNAIVFVGSLYKAKKIFELLRCYENAFRKNVDIPNLIIIGDGEEYQAVKEWIVVRGMEEKVVLTGAIFDDQILAEYFAKSYMCISPDQAGLSVLKAMGNGVPFVTHKDAITGGERFNIEHNVNGVLINDFDEIEDIILECTLNKEKYIEMGKHAYDFYWNNRTVSNMVKGFLEAIDYVSLKR